MIFGKRPPVDMVGDSWAVYSYTYGEGMRAAISFDVELAKEAKHRGHDRSIRVILRIPLIGRVRENGMPVGEELPKLKRYEDALVHALRERAVDCRFVGRMTYGGMREFVFQAEDVKAFKEVVSNVAEGAGDYAVEVKEEKGWKFFDEKVRPKPVFWQQITDQQVINGLIKAGSDPAANHVLEHTITGKRKKLVELRDELTASGFSEIQMGKDYLTVGKASTLDIDEVFAVTGKLFSYCETIGVKYDGWGADVVK